jgi:tripartite-type tricarboxylate transporter receptor subunit TctC
MKAFVCIFTTLFVVTPAFAQQPSQPTKDITWNVTVAEAQTILTSLGAGPWKDVNQLMQKLLNQANAQMVPRTAPPTTPPDNLPSKVSPPVEDPKEK